MELRQLRYFVALAEELHFRKAAEKLNMTQPPLSHAIKLLENEIGASLLKRGRKKNVSLTIAGETFLSSAIRILEESERAKRRACMAGEGEVGTLSIGHTDDFIAGQFPDLLFRFNSLYPNCLLLFYQMASDIMPERLNHGELDCIFTTKPLPSTLADCRIKSLSATPIVLVVSDNHRLAGRKKIKLREIADERHLYTPGKGTTAYNIKLTKLLVDTGIRIKSVMEPLSSSVKFEMVRRGYGVAFATHGSIPPGMNGLKVLQINETGAELERALIWRQDNINPTLNKFLELFDGDSFEKLTN